MPGMRVEALRLSVQTDAGQVGRSLRFTDGLNVLRADNSSGKSTALQSIIYALGLEGMLSPSHRIPLPHAMTDSVTVEGRDYAVSESSVEVQLSNSAGEGIVVSRAVVGAAGRDPRLISVTRGRAMTEPGDFARQDYFVRHPGAARNQAGFHRFFAEFLGLELPRVTKMDGSEVPLYLETLFPYFFVEQKHGWSGIQTRLPTYLGIREVGRRSAEYILGLDVFDRILRRQRIASNITEIEAEWQSVSRQVEELAKVSRVVLRDAPAKVSQGSEVGSLMPLVHLDGQWVTIDDAVGRLTEQVAAASAPVRTVSDDAPQLESDLPALEASLRESLAVASALQDERQELRGREQQLLSRIDALEEDLQRHKDSQLLERFGSEHAHSLIAEHLCPTCHQDLTDGADISAQVMTVAENIAFIRRQLRVFNDSISDVRRVATAIDVRAAALREQVRGYRAEIRSARETLSSAESSPSVSDISRRVELSQRLTELRGRQSEFRALRETLVALHQRWRDQRGLLADVRSDDLSPADEERLARVETQVRRQLGRYGFDSLEPDQVAIDRVTYRPTHEGFDLGFDLSASDMIRVIWAYLFALLNVGTQDGHHLGFLVFDEPRQQETARTSYQALLAHAATEGTGGSQILFATSETPELLSSMLAGHPVNLISLPPGQKLLLPMGSD